MESQFGVEILHQNLNLSFLLDEIEQIKYFVAHLVPHVC